MRFHLKIAYQYIVQESGCEQGTSIHWKILFKKTRTQNATSVR